MAIKILAPAFFLSLLSISTAFAEDGKVTISSPANGAMVSTHDNVELTYDAVLGTDGDHLHLYLDGKRIDVIRPVKGKATVGMLAAGKHHICLAVNTRAHVPTGAEGCIDVTAQ